MRTVLSIILGGGRGTRLFPLTKARSKPAVPVAGKYRLIDIPISNCINSNLNSIYVLTQFLSVSLHQHIANTYKFDMFGHGFVEILAAMQTLGVWAFHGGKDTVVPLGESRDMVEAFRRAGCQDIQLTVYPEAGHNSWTQAYADPKLYEWFLRHRRP